MTIRTTILAAAAALIIAPAAHANVIERIFGIPEGATRWATDASEWTALGDRPDGGGWTVKNNDVGLQNVVRRGLGQGGRGGVNTQDYTLVVSPFQTFWDCIDTIYVKETDARDWADASFGWINANGEVVAGKMLQQKVKRNGEELYFAIRFDEPVLSGRFFHSTGNGTGKGKKGNAAQIKLWFGERAELEPVTAPAAKAESRKERRQAAQDRRDSQKGRGGKGGGKSRDRDGDKGGKRR